MLIFSFHAWKGFKSTVNSQGGVVILGYISICLIRGIYDIGIMVKGKPQPDPKDDQKHPLVGKMVRINKGNEKGQIGQIVEYKPDLAFKFFVKFNYTHAEFVDANDFDVLDDSEIKQGDLVISKYNNSLCVVTDIGNNHGEEYYHLKKKDDGQIMGTYLRWEIELYSPENIDREKDSQSTGE